MISYEEGIEIYYNTGDTLPTEGIPASSIALNMDDWTVSIYNGILWVPKGSKMVETELVNGTFEFAKNLNNDLYLAHEFSNVVLVDGQTYTVVFDGVRYDNLLCIGEDTDMTGEGDFVHVSHIGSGDPFVYQYVSKNGVRVMAMFSTKIAGDSHDIIIKTYGVQEV